MFEVVECYVVPTRYSIGREDGSAVLGSFCSFSCSLYYLSFYVSLRLSVSALRRSVFLYVSLFSSSFLLILLVLKFVCVR